MKRIAVVLTALLAVLGMTACAANGECTYDAAKAKLAEQEKVYAYVYSEEKGYEAEAEAIGEMLEGEWTEGKRNSDASKVFSVTVDTQYEICLFDDGTAMIYCGYAQMYEKDRCYYTVKLNTTAEEMCSYVQENGTEVAEEEENNAPAAE